MRSNKRRKMKKRLVLSMIMMVLVACFVSCGEPPLNEHPEKEVDQNGNPYWHIYGNNRTTPPKSGVTHWKIAENDRGEYIKIVYAGNENFYVYSADFCDKEDYQKIRDCCIRGEGLNEYLTKRQGKIKLSAVMKYAEVDPIPEELLGGSN